MYEKKIVNYSVHIRVYVLLFVYYQTRPDFLQLMINNYKGERDADIKNGTIEMYKQRG